MLVSVDYSLDFLVQLCISRPGNSALLLIMGAAGAVLNLYLAGSELTSFCHWF